MRRGLELGGWALVIALVLLLARGPASVEAGEPGIARRLLGPFASLAASVQWVRADHDLAAGRHGRGYARAETALRIDPRSTAGWSFLAYHLVYARARPELEPDPAARAALVRAGIVLLERGEARADDPGRLAFEAGLALVHAAAYEDVLAWPGGAAEAWREAARHFERAARHGHPLGAAAVAEAAARARGERSEPHPAHEPPPASSEQR